jgi:hypothetical protein
MDPSSKKTASRSMQVKIGIAVASSVALVCGWVWTACFGGAIYVWLARDIENVKLCKVDKEDDELRQVDDSNIFLENSTRDLSRNNVSPKKKRKGFRHKLSRIFRRKRKKRNIRDDSAQRSLGEGDDEKKDEKWFLAPQSFPNTTIEERIRFLRARKGDVHAASAMLNNYLEWRAQFDESEHDDQRLPTNESDTSEEDPIWSKACILASSISPPSSLSSSDPIPPCILFFPEKEHSTNHAPESLRTVTGKRVLQHIPARIDLAAADAEAYATALALYIDLQVPHDSMEKICVVIDARPGTGWGNIPAPMLIPFIKHAAKLLNDLHPERLDSCILFPVPVMAKYLWNVVKPFLDPSTANKIQLLTGLAGVKSPVPQDLEMYLEKETIEWMERKRLSLFV